MADLAGYFDDSFQGSVYCTAGYLGHVDAWETVFSTQWNQVIENAPHAISEFKTSDCRHRRGEFSRWTREECDDLTRELVSVVVDACTQETLVGFGTVLLYPDRLLGQNERRNIEHHGYGMSIGLTFAEAIRVGAGFCSPDEKLHLVCDEKDGFYQRAVVNFEVARGMLRPELSVGLPESADSRKSPPLQAADLLAYEAHKEVKSRIEGRKTSRALERLVAGRFHRVRILEWDLLKTYERARESSKPRQDPPILFESGAAIRSDSHWPLGEPNPDL